MENQENQWKITWISRNKWSIDAFLIVFFGISVSKKKMVGVQHGIDMKNNINGYVAQLHKVRINNVDIGGNTTYNR